MAFNQDSRVGRTYFILRNWELTISQKFGGKWRERRVFIGRLDPEYRVVWTAFPLLWMFPAIVTIVPDLIPN